MTKKEVLKHLDELAHPMLKFKPLWSRDEVSAMYVQTYRSYAHVARLQQVEQSTIMRRCIRFINQLKEVR